MIAYAMRCDVRPQYLPDQSEPANGLYAFAYTVTVTNVGRVPAQLIARHWHIEDANGRREEVKGLGVVGQQPLLRPGEAFEYTSGTRLRTERGTMWGSYFCVAEDGERFDVEIAPFLLDAKADGEGRVLH